MAVDIAQHYSRMTYPHHYHLLSPPYLTEAYVEAQFGRMQDNHSSKFSSQTNFGDAGPSTADHRRRASEARQNDLANNIPIMPYPTPSGPSGLKRKLHSRNSTARSQQQVGRSSTSHYASSISTEPISELAAFAAQMLDFIWFGPVKFEIASTPILLSRPGSPSSTLYPGSTKVRPAFIPTPVFLRFCHDILALTQVSHSVVLLALLYVYRLKAGNPKMHGEEGSEYRLLVTAVLLANKYLDDNTYTNKTWSEVSNLSLKEINSMEVEFLRAVEHGGGLYTSEKTYYNWLKALEGLTFMKDKQTEKELRDDVIARESAVRDLAVKMAVQRARSLSPLAQWSDTYWGTLDPRDRSGDIRPMRRNSSALNEMPPSKRVAVQSVDYNESAYVDTPASSVSPLASYRHPAAAFDSLSMRNSSDPFTFAQGFSAADGVTLLASYGENDLRPDLAHGQPTFPLSRPNPMDLRFYSLAAGKRSGVGHNQQIDPQHASAMALAENVMNRLTTTNRQPTFMPHSSCHPLSTQQGTTHQSPNYIQSLPTSGFTTPSNLSPLMMPFTHDVQGMMRSGQQNYSAGTQSSTQLAALDTRPSEGIPGPQTTLQPSSFGLDHRHQFGPPRYTSAFANAGIPGVWMHSARGLESNFQRTSTGTSSSTNHPYHHRASQSLNSAPFFPS